MKSQHIQPTIVAGIDRKAADTGVLTAAIEQTRAAHARLVIVHALDLALGSPMSSSEREAYRRHIAADVRRQLEKSFDDARPDISAEIYVDWGGAATMLLAAGHDAAMIVIGTHGSGHQEPLLLGAVAQDIAVHSECPVLLVPAVQWGQA